MVVTHPHTRMFPLMHRKRCFNQYYKNCSASRWKSVKSVKCALSFSILASNDTLEEPYVCCCSWYGTLTYLVLKVPNKQFEIWPDSKNRGCFKLSINPQHLNLNTHQLPASTSSLNPLHCPAQYAHSTTSNVDTTLLRGHRHDRRRVLRHYGIHGQKSSLH